MGTTQPLRLPWNVSHDIQINPPHSAQRIVQLTEMPFRVQVVFYRLLSKLPISPYVSAGKTHDSTTGHATTGPSPSFSTHYPQIATQLDSVNCDLWTALSNNP